MDNLTDASRLEGWIPGHVSWQGDVPCIEWVFSPEPDNEPFYEDRLQLALRRPFNLLFRQRTSIEVMGKWAEASPGLAPTGFIFHVSRCGSTLVSSLLSRLVESQVISESAPLDALIQAHHRNPKLPEDQQIQWVRAMVSALGQKRVSQSRNLFIKFDAWSALQLPLLQKAFPQTPWIFLYRDPVVVLVSALARRGLHTIPGAMNAAMFGIDTSQMPQMSPEEYSARVLGSIYEAGLRHHTCGRSLLVNYTQLPAAIWTIVARHFGIELSAAETAHLQEQAGVDPKSGMIFAADSASKREKASAAIHAAAEQWMAPAYEKLEIARLAPE